VNQRVRLSLKRWEKGGERGRGEILDLCMVVGHRDKNLRKLEGGKRKKGVSGKKLGNKWRKKVTEEAILSPGEKGKRMGGTI